MYMVWDLDWDGLKVELEKKVCKILEEFKEKLPEELRASVEWWEGEFQQLVEDMISELEIEWKEFLEDLDGLDEFLDDLVGEEF